MPIFKVKFSGVTILQGVEISILLLIFEWALQQCSATALPVITFFCDNNAVSCNSVSQEEDEWPKTGL